ncbi:MAG: metallophosphoesterase [Myxococcaceae bacterium]|nr:metallophosphoesterase [Myxococcaceae bacterium]
MRFLHCSDIHITGDYQTPSLLELGWRRWMALLELNVKGRKRHFAQARETVRQITRDAQSLKVDHLIVSGDLTAYALAEEFKGARDALEPWVSDKQTCTVIHGNHDTYTPGTVRDHRFERSFGHLLESDWPEHTAEGPYPFVRLLGTEAAVVGLLSARVPLLPGFSFGVIGRAQLRALRNIVNDERLKNRAVLVVVHHAPLSPAGKPDKPMHGLVDAKELFSILAGQRFAVLHGHIHHRYHHPATADRPHIFGAGSSTQKGREGYWVIEVAGGKIASWQKRTPGALLVAGP